MLQIRPHALATWQFHDLRQSTLSLNPKPSIPPGETLNPKPYNYPKPFLQAHSWALEATALQGLQNFIGFTWTLQNPKGPCTTIVHILWPQSTYIGATLRPKYIPSGLRVKDPGFLGVPSYDFLL